MVRAAAQIIERLAVQAGGEILRREWALPPHRTGAGIRPLAGTLNYYFQWRWGGDGAPRRHFSRPVPFTQAVPCCPPPCSEVCRSWLFPHTRRNLISPAPRNANPSPDKGIALNSGPWLKTCFLAVQLFHHARVIPLQVFTPSQTCPCRALREGKGFAILRVRSVYAERAALSKA